LRGRKALTPEAVLDLRSALLGLLEGERRRGLLALRQLGVGVVDPLRHLGHVTVDAGFFEELD
jgi:hypothetical protein